MFNTFFHVQIPGHEQDYQRIDMRETLQTRVILLVYTEWILF